MHRPVQMKVRLLLTNHWQDGLPGWPRQSQAEEHLLYLLAGFGSSVIITRSFLEWTDYPQIATGELHIAHVLWGGLLLFAASLLLLIWRGRAVQRLSSVLTGIGFGLFIDEVGKFITQSNDYFYPLAAPIIYAFFLLTVLVYLGVRRVPAREGRTELHRVVALLETGVDPGRSREQLQTIRAELARLAETAPASIGQLAAQAGTFLEAEEFQASGHDGWAARLWHKSNATIRPLLAPSRLRRGLTLGFALLALRGLASGLAALFFIIALSDLERWRELGITATPLSAGGQFTTTHLFAVGATLACEGIVGSLFAGATISIIRGRTARGLRLAYWGLLLNLTAVRLFVLYFNQFDVILTTLLQFALLLGVLRYRSRHLAGADSASRGAGGYRPEAGR